MSAVKAPVPIKEVSMFKLTTEEHYESDKAID